MSITLKQFAVLINDFIERNFVTVLSQEEERHKAALKNWKEVKIMMCSPDQLDYWSFEAHISAINLISKPPTLAK